MQHCERRRCAHMQGLHGGLAVQTGTKRDHAPNGCTLALLDCGAVFRSEGADFSVSVWRTVVVRFPQRSFPTPHRLHRPERRGVSHDPRGHDPRDRPFMLYCRVYSNY